MTCLISTFRDILRVGSQYLSIYLWYIAQAHGRSWTHTRRIQDSLQDKNRHIFLHEKREIMATWCQRRRYLLEWQRKYWRSTYLLSTQREWHQYTVRSPLVQIHFPQDSAYVGSFTCPGGGGGSLYCSYKLFRWSLGFWPGYLCCDGSNY